MFFTFFILYRWYQIKQSVSYSRVENKTDQSLVFLYNQKLQLSNIFGKQILQAVFTKILGVTISNP